MTSISALIKINQIRWDAMKLDGNRVHDLDATAKRLVEAKPNYEAVEKRLVSLGYYVPWWFVAICSEREYGGPPHWNRQLAQGDPLDRVSWHEPAGRGPFKYHDAVSMTDAWQRGCLDALIDCAPHAAKWGDWSPGGTATIFEEYNGLGYANMGVPSAYVWSGSDQYITGKYVADHDYRAGVKDVQEGCMPILARMIELDKSIKFGGRALEKLAVPPPSQTPPTKEQKT